MNTPETSALSTVDDVGLALLTLGRAYRSRVGLIVGQLPQGPRGYQVLANAVAAGGPSQVALATLLGIDRTVMTYLIDDLVDAGMVERQENPVDRRQRMIVPTKTGIREFAALQQRVREAEEDLLESLLPDDRDTFRAMLGRVSASLRVSSLWSDEVANCP